MRVAIVTDRRNALQELAQGLGGNVEWLEKAEGVLAQARGASWQLVVVDGLAAGMAYKKFLNDLVMVNAMLNTVVITDMRDEDFHEDSEGLGVLCALPASPGREDGVRVMNKLCTVLGL